MMLRPQWAAFSPAVPRELHADRLLMPRKQFGPARVAEPRGDLARSGDVSEKDGREKRFPHCADQHDSMPRFCQGGY